MMHDTNFLEISGFLEQKLKSLKKDPSGPRIRYLAIIDRSLRSEDVVLYFRCLGASTPRELPIAHVFECLARGGNPLRGIQTSSSSLKILK